MTPALLHRASKRNDKLSGGDAKVVHEGRVVFDTLRIDNLAGRDISIHFLETASHLHASTGRFAIYPFNMELSFSADAAVAGKPIALSVRMNDEKGRVR